jgi:hypothetical protein
VIELNIGRADPVESVMLHVRGSGDEVLPVIHKIAALLNGRPVDISTMEFLEPTDTTGWHDFQAFRDRAVRDAANPPGIDT